MKRKRTKDYLGLEILHRGREAYVARIDRKKGIVLHLLADDEPCFCLDRKFFTKTKEGTRAYNDMFDTILIWLDSGEPKWNAIIWLSSGESFK